MTDNHTDSTIVEGIVCLWVEEWILEYSGRETNLVGRRVVVSIHRLRCHVPLVAIHWLAHPLVKILLMTEL